MSTQTDTRVVRAGNGFAQVSGQDATRASIEMLLATEPGDLPYDPERGVGAQDLLLMDAFVVAGVLEERVREQFQAYLPRVVLDFLQVSSRDDSIEIQLRYRDRRDGSTGVVQAQVAG